jgi:hypothetical protein
MASTSAAVLCGGIGDPSFRSIFEHETVYVPDSASGCCRRERDSHAHVAGARPRRAKQVFPPEGAGDGWCVSAAGGADDRQSLNMSGVVALAARDGYNEWRCRLDRDVPAIARVGMRAGR